jgi:hypothetical protein
MRSKGIGFSSDSFLNHFPPRMPSPDSPPIGSVARRKLIDYTKEGRHDFTNSREYLSMDSSQSSDQSFPAHRSSSMDQSKDSNTSHKSFLSAGSSSLLLEDGFNEEAQVEFWLKIPSRRRTISSSELSRKDLILACDQISQLTTRRRSNNSLRSLTRKEGRRPSFIDSILHREDMEELVLRRHKSKKCSNPRFDFLM